MITMLLRQGKARQGKARQGKARQGKARQVYLYSTFQHKVIQSALQKWKTSKNLKRSYSVCCKGSDVISSLRAVLFCRLIL